ncbi:MAG TPA: hypothetical protein VMI75_29970 [Polyangiaceae bacterium]|nr:hypothetical protein [Polyangiaceae bacterium]
MSEGKTPRTLDQALASWPMPERATPARDGKEIEWSPNAAPSARFEDLTDDELLGPPLPGSESSGAVPASGARDKARSKEHLQDLAKLAEMKPAPEPKEKEENSGVVHLAALAASEGQNVDGTPLQAAEAPAAAIAGATKATEKTGSNRPSWLMVGGLVAAAAVVALFFGMQHPGTEAPPAQVTVAAPAMPTPTNAATATPTATATNKDPLDKAVDPSTLPPADTSMAAGAHPSAPAAVAAAAPAKPAPAAAASAAVDPAVAANAPPPAPAGAPVNLESAMQQAAGPQSTLSTPTPTATEAPAAAPTSVVLKPSQGAIQGALGAALPAARGCLGPDDPISRASVTFQSDGTVQSVTVTGGAAGKPAEACIRSALMRAKVPPFAMPTFTAPATIRPN